MLNPSTEFFPFKAPVGRCHITSSKLLVNINLSLPICFFLLLPQAKADRCPTMGTKWRVLKAGWACSVHNHYLISPSLRTDPTSARLELTLLPGPKPFASHLQVREETRLPSATTDELFTVLFTCRWLSMI